VTYQSRIHVNEAWQYAGTLRDAPDFIDRNWVGFDDGPILRVPHYARPDGEQVICRVMDYVVRQEVKLAEGMPTMERIEVWPREEFERLFIPSRVSGRDPAKNNGPKAPPPDVVPYQPPDETQTELSRLLNDLSPPAGEGPPEPPATT
jgi:hypothetical protein